jgi:hypothetical protein
MTKFIHSFCLFFIIVLTISVSACSSNSSSSPPVGNLKVTVVDGANASAPIANANILLLDSTGDPVSNYTSDADGVATRNNLRVGTYQLKVSANSYSPSPTPSVPPLPVNIVKNTTTEITVTLFPHPLAASGTLGTISGKVVNGAGKGIAGALVVADDGSNPVSTLSASDGSYILYNIPAGDVDLTAFITGFNFPVYTPVTVTAATVTSDQVIQAESTATGSISGKVNFVAGAAAVAVDVTLLHPGTNEVIPGMRVYIDNGDNYQMNGIPNATFQIIASLENDGDVLDPDIAVTQGIPTITVNTDSQEKDFKVTGAIELDVPATPVNGIVPELNDAPVFEWHQASSYSNVTEYVVEVVDESGNTVWGGFDSSTGMPLVTVPKTDPVSVGYNFDATATIAPLESGRYYQLRVYASKDDNTTPLNFKLISSTENLDGVFRVQ